MGTVKVLQRTLLVVLLLILIYFLSVRIYGQIVVRLEQASVSTSDAELAE